MSGPVGDKADSTSLQKRIEAAAEGLVYSSESDRPFEWFFLKGGATRWPVDVNAFATLIGSPSDVRCEERTIARFFKPHIETSDPYDVQAQQIRPRYEKLKKMLIEELRSVRVFRIGRIEVYCYVVGGDGAGNLAGLRTVAVET